MNRLFLAATVATAAYLVAPTSTTSAPQEIDQNLRAVMLSDLPAGFEAAIMRGAIESGRFNILELVELRSELKNPRTARRLERRARLHLLRTGEIQRFNERIDWDNIDPDKLKAILDVILYFIQALIDIINGLETANFELPATLTPDAQAAATMIADYRKGLRAGFRDVLAKLDQLGPTQLSDSINDAIDAAYTTSRQNFRDYVNQKFANQPIDKLRASFPEFVAGLN